MVARPVFCRGTNNCRLPEASSAAGSETPQIPSRRWATGEGVGRRSSSAGIANTLDSPAPAPTPWRPGPYPGPVPLSDPCKPGIRPRYRTPRWQPRRRESASWLPPDPGQPNRACPAWSLYSSIHTFCHRGAETLRIHKINLLIPFFNNLELKFISNPTFLSVTFT